MELILLSRPNQKGVPSDTAIIIGKPADEVKETEALSLQLDASSGPSLKMLDPGDRLERSLPDD